jgi:predicted nucleic acid-binding protein
MAIGIRRAIRDVPDHTGKPYSILGARGTDIVSFAEVEVGGVIGHRQVTDAYLAQLARRRKGQLATLDSGLAHLHNDVAVLIPTSA